jgi:hypothetical protein
VVEAVPQAHRRGCRDELTSLSASILQGGISSRDACAPGAFTAESLVTTFENPPLNLSPASARRRAFHEGQSQPFLFPGSNSRSTGAAFKLVLWSEGTPLQLFE